MLSLLLLTKSFKVPLLGKSISVFLIILLSIPFLYKMGYLVYFTINKEAIIKEFCVNKANTKLKCDGKCHLKKQLNPEQNLSKNEQQKENDNSLLVLIKEIKHLQFLYILPFDKTVQTTFLSNYTIEVPKALVNPNYKADKGRLHLKSIFHPPAC